MKAVIDTNILLIADKKHQGVSLECILFCIDRLENLQKRGCVVIDDAFLIISEYQNKMDINSPIQTMGTAFLKWIMNNRSNQDSVEQVHLTERGGDCFEEFPDSGLESRFDPPDRKFVAVANTHPEKPPIWQASDCKWLNWWQELANYDIQVDFVCPNDIRKIYQQKFPDSETPALP